MRIHLADLLSRDVPAKSSSSMPLASVPVASSSFPRACGTAKVQPAMNIKGTHAASYNVHHDLSVTFNTCWIGIVT